MIIAYWNTQRASGLTSRKLEPQARCMWCCQQIVQWIIRTINAHQLRPSLIFLSEVSQGGGALAAYLTDKTGYPARYIAVGDRNDNASPCSFIVMWREDLKPEIEIVGVSQKRPMVRVRLEDLTVGAVHIIANPDKAPDEIFGDIAELHGESQPAVLIGDMNYAWSRLKEAQPGTSTSLAAEIKRLFEWTPVFPSLDATFGKYTETLGLVTQVLDYMWKSETVSRVETVPPYPGYRKWTMIDHAPIAYHVFQNDEDELMTDDEDDWGDDARIR
ncbi:endonuclease/exonuclease/phosphatase family protein [Corallococcus sp. AB004]|uniref:endonuclease/exonuclease/phosphatase family protein n=1 Tax=Corallococcus TaxID=83461 RepID=UPI000EA0C9B4|nr:MULTISPECIES: endonuclease/exonuclease/phosphatase family protein [Corallococcus]NPC71512.1 endonuclease/exonuclease/phosphatase family protein [Corallococcus exiguus]NPD25624.1 endonuclease/exonuclease/phosphatase family protein [Corallococcus exiguus]RKH94969.1 endonuclease/exonuclease/phosphatase family protein [Corallococcus sp. AB038B]RKI45893.1 endonuclease/exonuclease/phosphatase family protein [Corallococcus sp. AB004]